MSFPERRKRKKGKYRGPFTSSQDELDADEKFFKSAVCFSKAGGSRKKGIQQAVCACVLLSQHANALSRTAAPAGDALTPTLAKDAHLVTKVPQWGSAASTPTLHSDDGFEWLVMHFHRVDQRWQKYPRCVKKVKLCGQLK